MERFKKIISDAELLVKVSEAVLEAELESGLTLCYICGDGTIIPPMAEDYDTFCMTVIKKIEEAGFIYSMN